MPNPCLAKLPRTQWKSDKQAVPEFLPQNYYLGLWVVPLCKEVAPNGGNLMMTVWRVPGPETEWEFHYRFRYYKDDRIFDHEDEKSAFIGKVHSLNEAQCEEAIDRVFKAFAGFNTSVADFLPLRCLGTEVAEKLLMARRDWLHIKEEKN